MFLLELEGVPGFFGFLELFWHPKPRTIFESHFTTTAHVTYCAAPQAEDVHPGARKCRFGKKSFASGTANFIMTSVVRYLLSDNHSNGFLQYPMNRLGLGRMGVGGVKGSEEEGESRWRGGASQACESTENVPISWSGF